MTTGFDVKTLRAMAKIAPKDGTRYALKNLCYDGRWSVTDGRIAIIYGNSNSQERRLLAGAAFGPAMTAAESAAKCGGDSKPTTVDIVDGGLVGVSDSGDVPEYTRIPAELQTEEVAGHYPPIDECVERGKPAVSVVFDAKLLARALDTMARATEGREWGRNHYVTLHVHTRKDNPGWSMMVIQPQDVEGHTECTALVMGCAEVPEEQRPTKV